MTWNEHQKKYPRGIASRPEVTAANRALNKSLKELVEMNDHEAIAEKMKYQPQVEVVSIEEFQNRFKQKRHIRSLAESFKIRESWGKDNPLTGAEWPRVEGDLWPNRIIIGSVCLLILYCLVTLP